MSQARQTTNQKATSRFLAFSYFVIRSKLPSIQELRRSGLKGNLEEKDSEGLVAVVC